MKGRFSCGKIIIVGIFLSLGGGDLLAQGSRGSNSIAYKASVGKAALAQDLAGMAGKIGRGRLGGMISSVDRQDTLFTWNANTPMEPASTLKLLTTIVGLDRLGPEFRFKTELLYDGVIDNQGVLRGNIYLRGDGDPSLSARHIKGGAQALMDYMAGRIVGAGIRRITGSIIGDDTAFESRRIPEGWLNRYLLDGYAARVSALSLNENLIGLVVIPGEGARLDPRASHIRLVSRVNTVGGRRVNVKIERSGDSLVTVSGSIGIEAGPKKYSIVALDPAMYATGVLHSAIASRGVGLEGGIGLGRAPAGAKPIVAMTSLPLGDLIKPMNYSSINHYAELILRRAVRGTDEASQGNMAGANAIVGQILAQKAKADFGGISIADGSGLSTLNRITPRILTGLLAYAQKTRWKEVFNSSLSIGGQTGYLKQRFRGPAFGRVYAKTGTTRDVVSLSGYVRTVENELLAFTLIYNGNDRAQGRRVIDAMVETMAGFRR